MQSYGPLTIGCRPHVAPIHPKAMPVILGYEAEFRWLTTPARGARPAAAVAGCSNARGVRPAARRGCLGRACRVYLDRFSARGLFIPLGLAFTIAEHMQKVACVVMSAHPARSPDQSPSLRPEMP